YRTMLCHTKLLYGIYLPLSLVLRASSRSLLLFLTLSPRPPRSTLFPYTTLFRSEQCQVTVDGARTPKFREPACLHVQAGRLPELDRKSTRLNSSHGSISYAVFCLKKKKKT